MSLRQLFISNHGLCVDMNAEDFREYQREIGVGEVVIEEAVELFEEANRNNYTTGYADGVVKAAVMYLAASKHNEPRTIREFAEVADESKSIVGKTMFNIRTQLGIEIEPQKPEDYVPRICDAVGASEDHKQAAFAMIQNARSGDEYLNGSPNAIAGAAVYDCCPGANHEEVCEESGTLPGTLRNWRKRINPDSNLS